MYVNTMKISIAGVRSFSASTLGGIDGLSGGKNNDDDDDDDDGKRPKNDER